MTLFITAPLENYFSWSLSFYSGDTLCQMTLPCLFFIFPPPPLPVSLQLTLNISRSPSLFADGALSGFLMRCQHWRWNGGGARETPLKSWCSKQRETFAGMFCSKASQLLAPAARGRNRERVTGGLQLRFNTKILCDALCYCPLWKIFKSSSKEVCLPLSIFAEIWRQRCYSPKYKWLKTWFDFFIIS